MKPYGRQRRKPYPGLGGHQNCGVCRETKPPNKKRARRELRAEGDVKEDDMHQPTGPCRRCASRPATMWWVADGGTFTFVHLGGEPRCERCCVEEQLEHARKQAELVPVLERRLAELP